MDHQPHFTEHHDHVTLPFPNHHDVVIMPYPPHHSHEHPWNPAKPDLPSPDVHVPVKVMVHAAESAPQHDASPQMVPSTHGAHGAVQWNFDHQWHHPFGTHVHGSTHGIQWHFDHSGHKDSSWHFDLKCTPKH